MSAVIALALGYLPNASAQTTTQEEVVEEIVVTGSRIKRSNFEGPSPLQVINRADIEEMGAATVSDIVKNLSVNSGSQITKETGAQIGLSNFNIRNLGTGSTLTLINGRRTGTSAVADALGGQFVDLNSLPLNMFERIEILTDGASALYGSQAVAGVSNMITRTNFEGFEFSVNHQGATQRHQADSSVNMAIGVRNDGYRINAYATYFARTPNVRSDFDWFEERLNGNGNIANSALLTNGAGNYQRSNTAVTPRAGLGTIVADPDCEVPEVGGIFANNAGIKCRYPFAD